MAYNDLVRFYCQVGLSPEDKRKHSFLYKKNKDGPNLLCDGEYKTICSQRLVFGSKMSQFLANLAKIKTSETHILPSHPSVHEDLTYSYTDDVSVLSNISLDDIDEKKKVLQEGLAKGGFPMKEWVTSYEETKTKVDKNVTGFHSSMLGCFYNSKSDSWTIKAEVNFSKKIRNLRPVADRITTREELKDFIKTNGLKKINCLQAAHQLFDPLCLLLPIKANLSLAYRQLLIKYPKMEYEDFVPQEDLPMWEIIIGNLLDAQKVSIPRCVLPRSFDENTEIDFCVFCDGGGSASITRCFVRTSLPDGGYHVTSALNTFRLGHLGLHGAPQSEVTSMVNACRNIELIISVWKHLKFKSIHLFSDSTVCLASLSAFHSKLRLFFSSRVLEIQNIIEEHQVKVHFISGDKNPANYGSKLDLGANSVLSEDYWKVPFLEQEEKDWPVKSYNYNLSHISSLINPKMINEEEKSSLSMSMTNINTDLMDLIGRLSFRKVVNILSCYFQWKKEFRGDAVRARDQARQFLFRLSEPSEKQISGLERQYVITRGEAGIFLISRPFTLGDQTSQRKLRLLDGKSQMGRSILRDYHIHCCSTDRELCKIYEDGLFLVGARSYLQKVQKICKTCIKIRQITIQSLQGPGPQIEASRHPAYWRSMADIIGPIRVKVRSGTETRGSQPRRAYILSLTCLWSRHLSLALLNDLTADTFLSTLLTISSQLGGAIPAYLHSDCGSNIVTLKKLAGDDVDETEAGKITRSLQSTFRTQGIQLILSSPKSPWRQGALERLHLNFKAGLKKAGLYHQVFDISRWNFILSKMAYNINQRPLNIKFTNETWTVLTPNKLIFGERQGYFPREVNLNLNASGLYSQLEKLERSLEVCRDIYARSYQEEIQKFVTFKTKSDRSLQVGDVVMITDHRGPGVSNTIGQITELLSDRTVKLRYVQRQARYDNKGILVKPARMSVLIRPTQNLVYLTSPDEKFFNIDPYTDDVVATPTPVPTPSTTTTTTTPAPASTTPSITDLASSTDDVNVSGVNDTEIDDPGEDNDENPADDDDTNTPSPSGLGPKPKLSVKFIPEADSDILDINTVRKHKKKNSKKSK